MWLQPFPSPHHFSEACLKWLSSAVLRKLGDLFLKCRIAKQEAAPARDVLEINALKLLLGLELVKSR